MELSVNLEFSESLNEFKYQCITPQNEWDFKTVATDISFTDAQNFVEWVRGVFPHPMIYASVVCQWNVYKLKNKI